MASSSNPYDSYQAPQVEDDDDLIDPDDGVYCTLLFSEGSIPYPANQKEQNRTKEKKLIRTRS
jgi:hypothetical protein